MNAKGKYLYMFMQGGVLADLAVTEPILMAYADLIERAEALTRKSLEQLQFQATAELQEQSRWGAALLQEKKKIPPYFHSLLEKMYPAWSVRLASRLILDELSGRQQIMSLYDHLPLRPPWQQRTFGGMSTGVQFVLPHCSAGPPPTRIPIGEADSGFVENHGPTQDLSLLSGMVVRNLEGRPITLGRRRSPASSSSDGVGDGSDNTDDDDDDSEDYDHYHRNGEYDDEGEYSDDESGSGEDENDDDAPPHRHHRHHHHHHHHRKNNNRTKQQLQHQQQQLQKQQLLNQLRDAQTKKQQQQQQQSNIKIIGSASLRLSQSVRGGANTGMGGIGGGSNAARAVAATLEELEDIEHEQRTKRRKEARDVASSRQQGELGVLHLEDAEERRLRMMRSALDSEESGLAGTRKPTKPSSSMNQSRRKKHRASVFSTLSQRIANNVSESEMRDLQEGLHGASVLEPTGSFSQDLEGNLMMGNDIVNMMNKNGRMAPHRPAGDFDSAASRKQPTFRRKVKLPDYKNEKAPVSVLKSGNAMASSSMPMMNDDEMMSGGPDNSMNQQGGGGGERKKKRAVQFV